MIIQTGQRTDIPAFYADWFANRLREGYVMVRNPFNRTSVTRYELDPEVVDMIGFCSKDPAPMLKYMDMLEAYHQYWFVTITPYGRDIEPNVPPYQDVMETFRSISERVGINCIGWRYDPILINDEWTAERHIEVFRRMCEGLKGYTKTCVISFIQLYNKVKRGYPEARHVSDENRLRITTEFVKIAGDVGMTIKPCGDSHGLENTGADCRGCMTLEVYEEAIGHRLNAPSNPKNRKECSCYLTGDIGEYNTCGHLCRYCYANVDADIVRKNMSMHDPKSPFLIGHAEPSDELHMAAQKSWIDRQMTLDTFNAMRPDRK